MLIKIFRHRTVGRIEGIINTAENNILLGVPFWEDIEYVEETYTASNDYLHVKYKDGSKKSFIFEAGNWRPL